MKIYPFKFLDSYTKEDKEIFFGRNEESEQLYDMLTQSDIVLLYGASGTGKTSLIQCGLSNIIDDYDWLPFYIRRGKNLNESILNALQKFVPDYKVSVSDFLNDLFEEKAEQKSGEANQAIEMLKSVYTSHFKTIYLIFDQFEELFILGTRAEQELFVGHVKAILEMEQSVKLIFSVREEYLGHLYEFEKAVPQLMRKKLRVEPMNIDKVRQVLTGISTLENTNVFLEKGKELAVSDAIFDKLKAEKKLSIQLPYLQVFLDKFYLSITNDRNRTTEAVFTEKALQKIGDIGDVLSDFLEEQSKDIGDTLKKQYPETDSQIVWAILSPFATLEGTKDPISKSQLHERLPKIKPALIDMVVEILTNRRIVRFSEDENLYELAHDSLAKRIAEKRSDQEIALLEVRRLIKSQSSLKEEARELFSEKQILFIEPYLEQLILSETDKKLIDESRNQIKRKKEIALETERLEREKERKNQRRIIRIVSAAAVVALILAVVALWQMNAAQNEKQNAKKNEAKANNNLKQFYEEQAEREKNEFVEIEKRATTIIEVGACPLDLIEKLDSLANKNPDSTALKIKVNQIKKQVNPECYE